MIDFFISSKIRAVLNRKGSEDFYGRFSHETRNLLLNTLTEKF